MFARLTYIDIQPEHHDELRRIYTMRSFLL